MSNNFVSEVGFEVSGVSVHLGFSPDGQPMMAIGVDKTKNSADKTIAPLSDEAIVNMLAYVNRALVSRLDNVKSKLHEQAVHQPIHETDILEFKPKGK